VRDDGELGRELQRRVRVRGREVGGAEGRGEEAVAGAQPDHCRRRRHGAAAFANADAARQRRELEADGTNNTEPAAAAGRGGGGGDKNRASERASSGVEETRGQVVEAAKLWPPHAGRETGEESGAAGPLVFYHHHYYYYY